MFLLGVFRRGSPRVHNLCQLLQVSLSKGPSNQLYDAARWYAYLIFWRVVLILEWDSVNLMCKHVTPSGGMGLWRLGYDLTHWPKSNHRKFPNDRDTLGPGTKKNVRPTFFRFADAVNNRPFSVSACDTNAFYNPAAFHTVILAQWQEILLWSFDALYLYWNGFSQFDM